MRERGGGGGGGGAGRLLFECCNAKYSEISE